MQKSPAQPLIQRLEPVHGLPQTPSDPIRATPIVDLHERFLALQALLQAHRAFWTPSPFHQELPQWCLDRPQLAHQVLALDAASVDRYRDKPDLATNWLAPHLHGLAELTALSTLDMLPAQPATPLPPHLDVEIPGRKKAQIEAFASRLPQIPGPALEWCAGKAHLGRHLHQTRRIEVAALEIDVALCQRARQLAARHRVPQTILQGDATSPSAIEYLEGRDVVALHACGELHRRLVRTAADHGARSLHIAPCCYHKGSAGAYQAMSGTATLQLDSNKLRLAVTETVTAPLHDRRRLARDQAWKLGYLALRNDLGLQAESPFRPVPAAWLKHDFADFCRLLAARAQLRLPGHINWAHWEHAGAARREQVLRLEIVRHAYRRPLEIWLALDLALGLQERGFEVQIGCFCTRTLTPRNILISAHRHAGG